MPNADHTNRQVSFLQMIENNKAIIYKICHVYCPAAAEREDLAQEIIYQLWKSGNRFDTDRRFTTWMYRVALNTAISYYRKTNRTPSQEPLSAFENEIPAEENTAQDENRKELFKQIELLKEFEKALIILYLEGKNHPEIADILGISVSNVSTKLNRVKEKIKKSIPVKK